MVWQNTDMLRQTQSHFYKKLNTTTDLVAKGPDVSVRPTSHGTIQIHCGYPMLATAITARRKSFVVLSL
jgi:hypothetical protein